MEVTSTLVDQIIVACEAKGFDCTPQLASFLARCALLDPRNEFTAASEVSEKQAERLVEFVADKATQQDIPPLETIKMQIAVTTAKEEVSLSTKNQKQSHVFRSERLVDEIINKAEEAEVFGDMVLYILHETKLLDANNESVEKETMSALESVIPRNFINSFIAQGSEEKRTQLQDLWKIVWGIRVFNKATDKGGAGIEDYHEKIPSDINDYIAQMEAEVHESQDIISKYLTTLRTRAVQDELRILRLKSELINKRQFSAFAEQLYNIASSCKSKLAELTKFYNNQVAEVRRIVEENVSVPKSTIYPMFILLSENWAEFYDIFMKYKELKQLYNTLCTFKDTCTLTLTEEEFKSATELPQEERLDLDQLESDIQQEFDLMQVESMPLGKRLQINGYDPVSVAFGNGLLFKGESKFGYVKYKDNFYSFMSEIASKAFMKNPAKVLEGILDRIKTAPELIYLLGVESNYMPESLLSITRRREKNEISIQTETHPVESNIDHNYEFSVWKLRQRALKIAGLRNKRTHSSQTHMSHFRRDNETQAYPPKEKGTQTLKDKATQPEKHVRYVKGIRGAPDQNVSVMNLKFVP